MIKIYSNDDQKLAFPKHPDDQIIEKFCPKLLTFFHLLSFSPQTLV